MRIVGARNPAESQVTCLVAPGGRDAEQRYGFRPVHLQCRREGHYYGSD